MIAAYARPACDHAAFHAADDNPRLPLTTCPTCDAVLRTTPTTAEGWADHWAEQRADEDAWVYARLLEREGAA